MSSLTLPFDRDELLALEVFKPFDGQLLTAFYIRRPYASEISLILVDSEELILREDRTIEAAVERVLAAQQGECFATVSGVVRALRFQVGPPSGKLESRVRAWFESRDWKLRRSPRRGWGYVPPGSYPTAHCRARPASHLAQRTPFGEDFSEYRHPADGPASAASPLAEPPQGAQPDQRGRRRLGGFFAWIRSGGTAVAAGAHRSDTAGDRGSA